MPYLYPIPIPIYYRRNDQKRLQERSSLKKQADRLRYPRSMRCGDTSCRSLDGHAFRKISRLVDIAVPLNADMVREELEGNDVNKGC